MENEKAIEKDQETKTSAGAKKDELSDKDLEGVAGGAVVVTKNIELDSFSFGASNPADVGGGGKT